MQTLKYYLLFLPLLSWTDISFSQAPEYSNPIGNNIHLGDPYVLLDHHTYYLYGTTGGKGFKVWKSNDFKVWEDVGIAFEFDAAAWGIKSFWAPEVIHYKDQYYMTYSSMGPVDSVGFRLCLAVADRPEGPFRDVYAPWIDLDWSAIDAHIFVDEDQIPYLFFDKVGVIENPWHLYGIIYMVQLSTDLSEALTEPVLVAEASQDWEDIDPEHPSRCDEGAYVFKYGNTYYLTFSSGHYLSPKYAIGYATASSPFGPWVKAKENPLLKTDLTKGVSGPGHNSITFSPDGNEMFMVYHVHHDPQNPSGDRRVFIDRIYIDDQGKLHVKGPLTEKQPIPSGSE